MQKSEVRKKRIPGTKELFAQLKQITDGLNGLDEEIRECQDKLHVLVVNERTNSPRAKLLSELKEVKEVATALRNEKRSNQVTINDAKDKIGALRASMTQHQGGYDSIDKINKKLEDLELKLISTSVNAREEEEIASNMTQLRGQKNRLAEMENNVKTIDALDATIKECKAKMNEISKELAAKMAVFDSVKAELEKLAESSKIKSPEVAKLETRLTALKTQKADMIKARNAKRDEIHDVEVEFDKFETELHIQKSLEDQKDVIRKTINALKVDKESLLKEQSAYDPEVYDSLIYSVSKLKKSGRFSLEIDLVTHLMKYGIAIPNSIASLDQTIELLNQKKLESRDTFGEKKAKIGGAIAEIDAKIQVEVEKLNALPATNYEVLKKRGFRSEVKSKI